MSSSSKRRKTAALALAFVGVAGLSIASAAQLNLGTSSLGAGTTVVASCQPKETLIKVGFTNSFAAGKYMTTHVVLSEVDGNCKGLNYKVTLTDEFGNTLGEESAGEIGGAGTTTIDLAPTVSAADVTGVAVVIYS